MNHGKEKLDLDTLIELLRHRHKMLCTFLTNFDHAVTGLSESDGSFYDIDLAICNMTDQLLSAQRNIADYRFFQQERIKTNDT